MDQRTFKTGRREPKRRVLRSVSGGCHISPSTVAYSSSASSATTCVFVRAVVTRSPCPDELADPRPRHPAEMQERHAAVPEVVGRRRDSAEGRRARNLALARRHEHTSRPLAELVSCGKKRGAPSRSALGAERF